MKTERSQALFQRATKLMPGGVNSPVRAFGSVGGSPVFIESAKGSEITDADDNTYTDFVCSWGHPHRAGYGTQFLAALADG